MEVTKVSNPNSEEYSSSFLAGYNTPYLYNGKEIDRMHGLKMLDYGARWRESTIPSWTVPDPLCEKYYSISPYVYYKVNPVNMIDVFGLDPLLVLSCQEPIQAH